MKTACFLVTLFVAVVLAVGGAPASTPTPGLSISCPNSGDCTSTIQFDFTGLDPSTTYSFAGAMAAGGSCCGSQITPDGNGNFSFQEAFLSAGDWEFTLTAERKNGRPVHDPDIAPWFFTVP